MAEVDDKFKERFQFLFPSIAPVRYRLCPPDLHELRWSVFDQAERRTIGYGRAPEDAVDVAMDVLYRRQFIPPYQDELQLH